MTNNLLITLLAATLGVGAYSCKKTEKDAVTAGKPEEIAEAQKDLQERADEARGDAKEAREDAKDERKDVREEQADVNKETAEARAKTAEANKLEQLSYEVTGVEDCDKYLERVRKCDKLSESDRNLFLTNIAGYRKTMFEKTDDAKKRVEDACEKSHDAWDNMLKANGCN